MKIEHMRAELKTKAIADGKVKARLTKESRDSLKMHFYKMEEVHELYKEIIENGEAVSRSYRIPMQFETEDGSRTADLAEAIIQCKHIAADQYAGDPEDNPYSTQAKNLVYIWSGKKMTVAESKIAEHGWDSHDMSLYEKAMDGLAFRLRNKLGIDVRCANDTFEWLINNEQFIDIWVLENKGGDYKGFRSVYFSEADYYYAKAKDDEAVATEARAEAACEGTFEDIDKARMLDEQRASMRYLEKKAVREQKQKAEAQKAEFKTLIDSMTPEQLAVLLQNAKEAK